MDVPVSHIELENGVSSGVYLKSLASGLVPVYEENLARLERGINIDAWMDMPEIEKALIIASRRTQIAVSNLQAEAEIRRSQRKSR